MIVSIGTLEEPFYTTTVALEGVNYIFTFKHIQRKDSWMLDVALQNGTSLVAGIHVVCGVNLLWRSNSRLKPPGLLVAVAAAGATTEPPTFYELGPGKRVELMYTTSDELAAS